MSLKNILCEYFFYLNIYFMGDYMYINNILIVNKCFGLDKSFIPKNTYINLEGVDSSKEGLCKETIDNFTIMKKDASKHKLNIWIESGYRSYKYQEKLYNNYVIKYGKSNADTFSAKAGHSEHQTGLALDLNTIDDTFINTLEYKWINENAYKYGFIIRYPLGKENITGYKFEPWHLRYVGYPLSKTLYNNGNWITLEEYFNLNSKDM